MLSGLLTAIHQPGFCKAIQIRRKTSASNKARINFLHVRQTSFSYNIPKARRRASSTRSIAALLLNRFASVNSTAHTGWGEFLITWRAPSPYWLLLAGTISISTFQNHRHTEFGIMLLRTWCLGWWPIVAIKFYNPRARRLRRRKP